MTIAEHLWIDATVGALRDSVAMFEADTLDLISMSDELPPYTSGAYISVAGAKQAVEVGVVCGPKSQLALAQKFLGEEAALADDEVADAMREVANILAGSVKTAMIAHDPSLSLGLPMFVERLHAAPHTRAHCATVRVSEHELVLIVIVSAVGEA